jgi:prepilin signal peptidase PulO-like enzyme (type II secretory pathway)
MKTIRLFLALEAAAFFAAALVHAGHLVPGYEHHAARIAESVLGLVLVAGLAGSLLRPALTRAAGLAAQGFALLGTLVGVLTILVGVGPRSAPDVVYHVAMVAALAWGLRAAARTPAGSVGR